ncbi:hypothetical protein [Streptomyces buecherae]|uniref:hypothetical protein n=1 Tax=Streptomyces buecherae TaxID=2763006 RepID=UPI003662DAF5
MPHWSDYSDGERIKILRGSELNQAALAELTGLSIATVSESPERSALTRPSSSASRNRAGRSDRTTGP